MNFQEIFNEMKVYGNRTLLEGTGFVMKNYLNHSGLLMIHKASEEQDLKNAWTVNSTIQSNTISGSKKHFESHLHSNYAVFRGKCVYKLQSIFHYRMPGRFSLLKYRVLKLKKKIMVTLEWAWIFLWTLERIFYASNGILFWAT